MRTLKILLVMMSIMVTTYCYAAVELAKINNTVITVEDFDLKYKESLKFFRYKAPTKKNVLEDMIKREVGIQEAKKIGLDKNPDVIERMNTVLYHSLIDSKLSGRFEEIQITDADAKDYYKKNPEVRTSHIFVQLRFDATQAQQKVAYDKIKKIQRILTDALKAGKKTFSEVAREHSEGIAAATGGDIDYQTKDKLDPTYYAAAVALKVGGTGDVIRSQFGYHIIKLTAVKDFKDVDVGQYKRIIFDEKRAKIFDAYMDELKSKNKVVVHNDLLKD